jgi:hypothetical protein
MTSAVVDISSKSKRYLGGITNTELRELVSSYNYALADKDITVGDTTKVAFAFGGNINNGRGHMTAYVAKTDTDPILQGEYDISACALRRN